MFSLMKRNLTLYFKDRSGLFFSILSSLIVLGLYIVFLKNGMLKNWSEVPHTVKVLDPWLIGGMLSVTATTPTLAGINRLVKDREQQQLQDFLITLVKPFLIQLGYFLSAVVIGIIMQIIVFLTAWGYFAYSDNIEVETNVFLPLLGLAIINAFSASAISLLVVTFIKKLTTLSTVSSIISTASGFFSGIYIPIGSLPTFAQTLIKIYPGSYSASLYRRLLMNNQLSSSFKHLSNNELIDFKKQLGIGYQWQSMTSSTQEFSVLIIALLAALLIVAFKSFFENRLRKDRRL
ncbi:ABC transporter permease [Oenococcus oeni]|uniref:ABC transporter permease n=1 Tax=Oenococcus oeni TaxID=1247 RepID=UPI00148B1934|nr:ABC transporter permease [Oenococcus oeni]QJU68362.1 ABC transporter permease [Oenococcus oeni]